MLPLSSSLAPVLGRELVTFVVYAALGGVFFLLVVLLQISLGYSAIAAGAASLPITGLMLDLGPRRRPRAADRPTAAAHRRAARDRGRDAADVRIEPGDTTSEPCCRRTSSSGSG